MPSPGSTSKARRTPISVKPAPARKKRERPNKRPGLRDVASASGVCLMTVSLSLRNSPKISQATRERVQRIARELGYHPDPEISRLMQHLRTSRTSRGTTGLAVVDFYPSLDFAELAYHRRIRNGIVRRSAELGFSVDQLKAAEYRFNLRNVLNVVRNRGVEGVVLFPSVVAPLVLDPAVDWNGISVVAVTNSILAPRFHSVAPHQFSNMMRLIESAQAHGYRRIGMMLEESFDERTAHHFTAAMDWHKHGARVLLLRATQAPEEKLATAARWIAAHTPDLIFAQSPDLAQAALATGPHTATIAALGTPNDDRHSCLDEHPEEVGTAAVDLLAGMMYYHETGIPAHPRTTMIYGQLRLDSLSARGAKAGAG
jgi:LacI family transcriptional regulator